MTEAAGPDFGGLLRELARGTAGIIGGEGALVVLDIGDVRHVAGVGSLEGFAAGELSPDGLLLRTAATGELFVVDDLWDDDWGDLVAGAKKWGVRAAAVVPILRKGEPAGCIGVASRQPGTFTPERVRELESLAGLIEAGIAAMVVAQVQEASYEAVVGALEEGVITFDATGAPINANRRAAQILGVDVADLLGGRRDYIRDEALRLDGSIWAPEDLPAAVTLRTGKPVVGAVLGLRRQELPVKWLSLSTHPVRVADGRSGAVLSLTDVTDRVEAERALARREAEFRLLADHTADVVSRHLPDTTFLYASPAVEAILGYSPGELVGRRTRALWHPDDWDRMRSLADRTLAGERIPPTELRMTHRNGRTVWVEVLMSSIDYDGHVELLMATRDITDRKRTQAELQAAQQQFRTAFADAPVGMALARLGTRGVRILQVNAAFCSFLGRTADELAQMEFREAVHPADQARQDAAYVSLRNRTASTFELEQRFVRSDGRVVWGLHRGTVVTDDPARDPLLITQVADITDRKAAEAQIAHQALHDPLTDLPNRTLFFDRAAHAIKRGATVAIIVVDLDRFKAVNELVGHEGADQVLVAESLRLLQVLRPGDTLARFGGDEFVVLAEDVVDEGEAVALADEIQVALAEPLAIAVAGRRDATEVLMTASIGVAVGSGDVTAEALAQQADAAAALAKERGGAHVERYAADTVRRTRTRIDIAAGLVRALERDELVLHYQPEVDLRTGSLVGLEALVRWEHPERGLLPPSEFMPIAEDSGIIDPLGGWVLTEATRQMAEWRATFPHMVEVGVAVNVSGRQLADPELFDRIVAAVELLPGGAPLCVEVTETALLELPLASDMLGQFKRKGVLLGIDDFGTGYSSLSYVARLAPDFLKVDRSFVSGLGRDANDTAIVGAVIGLAHSLGLFVVAEGVEDDRQIARLRDLGCDIAQGYRVAKPMAPDELAPMLAEAGRKPLL